MKKDAIFKLAHVDAKKTSKLIFEALFSAMQKGWNREDVHEVIDRLNRVDANMKVHVYRSEVVASRFGEIEEDKQKRPGKLKWWKHEIKKLEREAGEYNYSCR